MIYDPSALKQEGEDLRGRNVGNMLEQILMGTIVKKYIIFYLNSGKMR